MAPDSSIVTAVTVISSARVSVCASQTASGTSWGGWLVTRHMLYAAQRGYWLTSKASVMMLSSWSTEESVLSAWGYRAGLALGREESIVLIHQWMHLHHLEVRD